MQGLAKIFEILDEKCLSGLTVGKAFVLTVDGNAELLGSCFAARYGSRRLS